MHYRGLVLASLIAGPFFAGTATAAPLTNDLFEAAQITATSGFIGDSPNGLFGGTGFGGQEEGNTIFADTTAAAVIGGGDPVHFIEFTPQNGPVSVGLIIATFQQDGGGLDANRGAVDFSLIADTNGILGFQSTDAFLHWPVSYNAEGFAQVTVPFVATASQFRLEVDPRNTTPFFGVRINELDALVPEPGALGLLAVGGATALLRRRHRR